MYNPPHFQENRAEILHQFMREYPFAAIVAGLKANHVPLLVDPDPKPYGTLRGHIARANHELPESGEVLVIFTGPSHYISPSWYLSKQEHGRVVPTWNYAVVHATGRLRLIDDRDWLRRLVRELTETHEQSRPQPWSVDDAPAEYTEALLGAIVGVEIAIHSLEGKWKLGQNRPVGDRIAAAEALAGMMRRV